LRAIINIAYITSEIQNNIFASINYSSPRIIPLTSNFAYSYPSSGNYIPPNSKPHSFVV
jgi:hypothetical protein